MDRSTDLRELLQSALTSALRAQDRRRASLLRTVLSAIANAEAVPDRGSSPYEPVLGFADVPRRQLSAEEVEAVVMHEAAERRGAAAVYRTAGREDEAVRLEADAAALERLLART